MTEDEALMLADYLNYSKVAEDNDNIITNDTISFVTSLIPKIFDKFEVDKVTTKCDCGSEMFRKKEPCFFNDNCKGCGLCENGYLNLVECRNPNCFIKNANLELE
jgi:hypothetical protein